MVRRHVLVNGHCPLQHLLHDDAIKLPDNREMALKSSDSQKKRLNSNIDVKLKYTEQINTVINSDYAEIVPNKQVYGKNEAWHILHLSNAKNPTIFEWFVIAPP